MRIIPASSALHINPNPIKIPYYALKKTLSSIILQRLSKEAEKRFSTFQQIVTAMNKSLFSLWLLCIIAFLSQCHFVDAKENTLALAILPDAELLVFSNKVFTGAAFTEGISKALISSHKGEEPNIPPFESAVYNELFEHTDILVSINVSNALHANEQDDALNKITWLYGMEIDDDYSRLLQKTDSTAHEMAMTLIRDLQKGFIRNIYLFASAFGINDLASRMLSLYEANGHVNKIADNISLKNNPEFVIIPGWNLVHTQFIFDHNIKEMRYDIEWAISNDFKHILCGPRTILLNQLAQNDLSTKETRAQKAYSLVRNRPIMSFQLCFDPKTIEMLSKENRLPSNEMVIYVLSLAKNAGLYFIANGNELSVELEIDFMNIVHAKYFYEELENNYLKRYRAFIDLLPEKDILPCMLRLRQHRNDTTVSIMTRFDLFDIAHLPILLNKYFNQEK